MKRKKNARDLREENRKKLRERRTPAAAPVSPPPERAKTSVMTPVEDSEEKRAADAKEFLDYLEKTTVIHKEENVPVSRAPRREGIREINLEEGMPLSDEAILRMRTLLQTARVDRVGVVKLIHGYGSTGRGGRIRVAVLSELRSMKSRRLIRDYVPGEDFGPFSEAARDLVTRCPALARDRDYGRCNRGVTVVVL